jgi:uncharacterized protein YukE
MGNVMNVTPQVVEETANELLGLYIKKLENIMNDIPDIKEIIQAVEKMYEFQGPDEFIEEFQQFKEVVENFEEMIRKLKEEFEQFGQNIREHRGKVETHR